LVFCALLIVLSYVIITINFIVTMVESYILVSVGFVFLGFGGSRWTAPYVERFIGLAVAIGIKILLLYCLIASGMNLGLNWIDQAQSVSASARPLMTAFDVMGAAIIFMMLCWQIPKLFAGVLGGAPTLTGGDFAGTVGAIASAALAAGSTLGTGAGMLVGGGTLASRATGAGATGGSGPASVAASAVAGVGAKGTGGGATVAPPTSFDAARMGVGTAARSQPDPPSKPASQTSALFAIGGQPLAGSGFENERAAKGFRPGTATANSPDSPSLIQQTLFEKTGEAAAAGVNSGVSEVASTTSSSSPLAAPVQANPWMGMASRAQKVHRSLSRAAYQIYSARLRARSDAAPSATPPRMPTDHHKE
jgi:type IV secretion system protein TrbL